MMKAFLKKIWKKENRLYTISASILLILIFTNPTVKDFNNYLTAKGFNKSVQGGRVNNFFIFSVYELNFKYGVNRSKKRRVKSIGIFGNFIVLVDEK